MADLSKFTNEERALIVSIPYRVGVWVSNVDDNTKSKIDDREERKALEATISGLASKSQKLPFAAVVMKEVEQSKSVWPAWEEASSEEKVLGDVQKALLLCKDKISGKDINHYKQTIWRVGIVVAQAFGEQIDPDNEMHFNNVFKWMGSLRGGVKLGKNPENMSKKEKIALNQLRAMLKD